MTNKPDILFIVLDTQRADRLGCYGYPRGLTPHLDRFAAAGAVYQQAIAPAQWTIPSHASMFTGLYPTAHQVTQSNQSLSNGQPHLVEMIAAAGYETVGFCNNPLVGVLDNGFRRGFEQFYNYGGAAPNIYNRFANWPPLLQRLVRGLERTFRRFADPIQNYFGHSEWAFRLSISAWLTPIWSRFANFKGQNERSVRHLVDYLTTREQQPAARPLFLFLNLMETHLPFLPPPEFIAQTAPYVAQDAHARSEMRRWNREAYRWAAPLDHPLSTLEHRLLNDLYDAEVAYQDSYLGPLLALLGRRNRAHDTLTVIVGDHGDGLGEHNMVGHAFNAYQELVRVPLIVHWPEQVAAQQTVAGAVSTRRVFHTFLEAAGVEWRDDPETARLSLVDVLGGHDAERFTAYAEVYPPVNFVSALERRQPHLIERYRCRALRRAIVQKDHKLVRVDAQAEELYDLATDPAELNNHFGDGHSAEAQALDLQVDHFVGRVERQRAGLTAGETFELQDERLLQQLRGLGYIE